MDAKCVNEQDRRLTELPDETWDRMIGLVLTGTFRCVKHVGPQMVARKSGSIILTATTDALIGCAASGLPTRKRMLYLASDESAAVTGGVFPIDVGYIAFKANIDVMGVMGGQE